MTGPAGPESHAWLRDRLGSMQSLLTLSMVMTESGDDQRILHLATTSVSTLGQCRVDGVHLTGDGWRLASGPCADADVRADVEAQLTVLNDAGGAVAIAGEAWAAAVALRGPDGHFGYLLVAADQQPPAFDQFLVRVLAQQTAIALANARLHARERAAAAELRATNATMAAALAAFERRTAIHDRLTRVAVAGEGLEGIARAVHELTGYPAGVEDRRGRLLAWAGPDQPDPYRLDPPAVRERLLARARRENGPLRDDQRLLAITDPGPGVVGVLVLLDCDGDAAREAQAALEYGATVLAIELTRLHGLADDELRLGREVVDELLVGNHSAHLLSRARALGYAPERPYRVVLIDSPGLAAEAEALLPAVQSAARDARMGPFIAPIGHAVVVLAESDRPWPEFHATVRDHLGGARCRMGVGGARLDPADFPRSHREAELAIRMQDRSGIQDRATVFDQLGVYRLLAEVEDAASIESFVRKWLGPLLDYDAKRHSDLVPTLSRYLEHGRTYDTTAKALAVHRSTLRYRLQRIREISGYDLTDPETQFNLQLATRARQTLAALRSS